MKKISVKALKTLKIIAVLYISICVVLYFFQENLIFFPEKLSKNYKFKFNQSFEVLNLKTDDNILLNGVLFKADSSKGLIFFYLILITYYGFYRSY